MSCISETSMHEVICGFQWYTNWKYENFPVSDDLQSDMVKNVGKMEFKSYFVPDISHLIIYGLTIHLPSTVLYCGWAA